MNQKEKSTSFSVIVKNTDPIVNSHQIHGINIMPGVCFLEIMYRALKIIGYSIENIVLKNILFKQPVITTEYYDKKILANIVKYDTYLLAKISSIKIKEGKIIDDKSEENFECEIFIENFCSKIESINITDLIHEAKDNIKMESVYQLVKGLGIVHYGFMKGNGTLHIGKDYLLTHLCLNDFAMEYLDNFIFHPVLLDASTLIPFFYHSSSSKNTNPYIPIFIESFRIFEELKGECFVYMDKPKQKGLFLDVISSDYLIYNESGNPVAVFSKLTGKKIRNKENINKLDYNQFKDKEARICSSEENASKDLINNDIQTAQSLLTQILIKYNKALSGSINTKVNFYDLGFDSVQLLQIVQELEKYLNTKLYPTLLFEYQNIEELSHFLENRFSDVFAKNQKYSTNTINHLEEISATDTNETETYDLIYFTNEWKEQFLNESSSDKLKNIILFDCNDKLKNILEKLTNNKSIHVILVKSGQCYKEIKNDIYEINYNSSPDYDNLVKAIYLKFREVGTIIYPFNFNWDDIAIEDYERKIDCVIKSLLYVCKAMIKSVIKEYPNIICYFPGNDRLSNPYCSAISGFSKTLMQETNIICKTVITPTISKKEQKKFAEIILKEIMENNKEFEVLYDSNNKRFVKIYYEFKLKDAYDHSGLPVQPNGVYIITGGAGGLGLLFAKLLSKKEKCNIILTGRSLLNEDIEIKLKQIAQLGSNAEYINCDISKKDDVAMMFSLIYKKYGHINGLIHCAGVIRDSFIMKKTMDELESVLAPKIEGAILLDQMLANEKLDFFILISSLSAVIGNPGQSDYAYANAFMDGFAAIRNEKVREGYRHGKTISLNYPLWRSGGMKVNDVVLEDFREMGFSMLETADGLNFLNNGYGNINNSLALVVGNATKIKKLLGICDKPSIASGNSTVDMNNNTNIKIIGEYELFFDKKGIDQFWQHTTNECLSSNKLLSEKCINSIPTNRLFHILTKTYSGIEVEVFLCGTGKTFLFIPPFGMTARIWSYQLMKFSKNSKVIIINMPGHGLSTTKDNLSIEEVSKCIFDSLKILNIDEKVNLVGASFGGLILQQFAIDYPSMVSSLILIGSFSRLSPKFISLAPQKAMANFSRLLKKELESIDRMSVLSKNDIDDIKSFVYRSLSLSPTSGTEKINLLRFSTWDKLEKIVVPCMLIQGQKDLFMDSLFCPNEDEYMMTQISNARLLNIENAGHFLFVTHWMQINEEIQMFVDNI